MTPEGLSSLIAGGETLDVEFKLLPREDLEGRFVGRKQPAQSLLAAEEQEPQHPHGRITRAEAAELCKLSPDQAYRLLQRLAESERLTRHGTKKGAWYARRA